MTRDHRHCPPTTIAEAAQPRQAGEPAWCLTQMLAEAQQAARAADQAAERAAARARAADEAARQEHQIAARAQVLARHAHATVAAIRQRDEAQRQELAALGF